MKTGGHRKSDFERPSTMRLHRLQERCKCTSQVPPENVQEVKMQALDADEMEDVIERRE